MPAAPPASGLYPPVPTGAAATDAGAGSGSVSTAKQDTGARDGQTSQAPVSAAETLTGAGPGSGSIGAATVVGVTATGVAVLEVGTRVMCKWRDGQLHPAKVIERRRSSEKPGEMEYYMHYLECKRGENGFDEQKCPCLPAMQTHLLCEAFTSLGGKHFVSFLSTLQSTDDWMSGWLQRRLTSALPAP